MSLPPLLLERLKRRKIIQEAQSQTQILERQDNDASIKPSESTSAIEHEHHLGETSVVEALDQEQEEIIAENYSDEEEGNEEKKENGERDEEDDQNARNNSPHEIALTEDQSNKYRTSDEENVDDISKCEQTQPHFREEAVIGCPNKYNIYHECGQYCIDNYSEPESLKPTVEQRKQLALILRTYPMSNEWTVVYDPGVRTFYFWNIISNLVSWLPPGMNGYISMPADQMRKIIREMGHTQDAIE